MTQKRKKTEASVITFKVDNNYVNNYVEQMKSSFKEIASNTNGALTYYIRFNPDYTNPTSGIFASRNTNEADFNDLVPTDFSMYSKDDLEHVGWYYVPINNNKATWMDPYYNDNINKYYTELPPKSSCGYKTFCGT